MSASSESTISCSITKWTNTVPPNRRGAKLDAQGCVGPGRRVQFLCYVPYDCCRETRIHRRKFNCQGGTTGLRGRYREATASGRAIRQGQDRSVVRAWWSCYTERYWLKTMGREIGTRQNSMRTELGGTCVAIELNKSSSRQYFGSRVMWVLFWDFGSTGPQSVRYWKRLEMTSSVIYHWWILKM